ncbi:MAG: hypothetical protein ACK48E_06035 [Holosporales bacterium]
MRLHFLLAALFCFSWDSVALAAKGGSSTGISRPGALESFASNEAIDTDRFGVGAVVMSKKATSSASPRKDKAKHKAHTAKSGGKKAIRNKKPNSL